MKKIKYGRREGEGEGKREEGKGRKEGNREGEGEEGKGRMEWAGKR